MPRPFADQWVDAPFLSEYVSYKLQDALEAYLRTPSPGLYEARLLQEALLAALSTGTLLPPLRASLVAELQVPAGFQQYHPCGRCLRAGSVCAADCMGATMVWMDPGCTKVGLHFEHHKTVRHTRRAIALRELPDVLNQLAVAFIKFAHPLLTQHMAHPVHTCFFTKTGAPVSSNSWAQYWRRMVFGKEAQSIKLCPQLCRHIFVTEALSRLEDGRPAPDPLGASEIMGNSPAQWHRSYYLESDYARAVRVSKAVDATVLMMAENVAEAALAAGRRLGAGELQAAPTEEQLAVPGAASLQLMAAQHEARQQGYLRAQQRAEHNAQNRSLGFAQMRQRAQEVAARQVLGAATKKVREQEDQVDHAVRLMRLQARIVAREKEMVAAQAAHEACMFSGWTALAARQVAVNSKRADLQAALAEYRRQAAAPPPNYGPGSVIAGRVTLQQVLHGLGVQHTVRNEPSSASRAQGDFPGMSATGKRLLQDFVSRSYYTGKRTRLV